ncbi:MAG: hypothetical protein KKD35_07835, partial [Elusimicrobia bacterium]|nr:hypothetical protein [Elusimicrobiota bacterium]
MKEKYNKTILTVLMKWDYCDEKRGFSYEKHCFFDNFSKLVDRVEPFWYDEYINNIPKLRRELLKKCEEVNPDLIFFIPYSNQFDTKTLDVLKKNWKTCVWFGDDTWRFESFSSKLAKSFSYICTTDIFRMQDYRKLGVEPILTQWGAQSLQNLEKIPLDIEYEYEVSFVGAK